MLLLLAACQNDLPGYIHKDTDTGLPTDTGHDSTPIDTEDTDGDLDDDGFTPEDGDCDDNDIHVSPAREEDPTDGKDNDCDGRVDELWSGVTALYVPADGSSSSLFVIDTIGNVQDEMKIKGAVALFLDSDPVSGGWVVCNYYADVGIVDTAGQYTMLADFSDTEVWPNGVYGVAVGADGTIYATTGDSLVTVGRDGTVTTVATWGGDMMAPDDWDLFGFSLAYDPETGAVGIFDGVTDGFATYTAAGGVTVERRGSMTAPVAATWAGAHMDNGGWVAAGYDYASGSYGIFSFDGSWTEVEQWTDTDWSLWSLATDGDVGDYYVTAYGGWYPSVWRIVGGTDYAADFYVEEADQYAFFYGIVSNY